jgi:hypothetical protein
LIVKEGDLVKLGTGDPLFSDSYDRSRVAQHCSNLRVKHKKADRNLAKGTVQNGEIDTRSKGTFSPRLLTLNLLEANTARIRAELEIAV